MHVRIAGQVDSNTSNDDASIAVGYGNAGGGGSGSGQAPPAPVIPVTVQALQSVFSVSTPVGRCTSDGPPSESLYTVGGVPSKALLTVLLPDGSTFHWLAARQRETTSSRNNPRDDQRLERDRSFASGIGNVRCHRGRRSVPKVCDATTPFDYGENVESSWHARFIQYSANGRQLPGRPRDR